MGSDITDHVQHTGTHITHKHTHTTHTHTHHTQAHTHHTYTHSPHITHTHHTYTHSPHITHTHSPHINVHALYRPVRGEGRLSQLKYLEKRNVSNLFLKEKRVA